MSDFLLSTSHSWFMAKLRQQPRIASYHKKCLFPITLCPPTSVPFGRLRFCSEPGLSWPSETRTTNKFLLPGNRTAILILKTFPTPHFHPHPRRSCHKGHLWHEKFKYSFIWYLHETFQIKNFARQGVGWNLSQIMHRYLGLRKERYQIILCLVWLWLRA